MSTDRSDPSPTGTHHRRHVPESRPQEALFVDDEQRWEALTTRDGQAAGAFVYAVRSTGIYCRPGCPARLPKRSNVAFYISGEQARAAGFRPCKRCQPDGLSLAKREAAAISWACRLIETAETPPPLGVLAAAVGFSPYHFHRRFKAVTGLTPKAYAQAHQRQAIREALAHADRTVAEAIYGAGYGSNSRFYEASDALLGMTPTLYRDGGREVDITFAIAQCTLGALLVACSAKGVCAISLGEDPDALAQALQDRFPKARLVGDDPDFDRLVAQVVGMVEAPGLGCDLPLDIRGTAFQQRVWQALRDIPPGQTASYADIARRIGAPTAVRAVAQACAANTLAVAIPCHRVVRTDGSLSGYRWGVERKRALLDKEAGHTLSPSAKATSSPGPAKPEA